MSRANVLKELAVVEKKEEFAAELRLLIADADSNLVAKCLDWCSLKRVALQAVPSAVACLEELRRSPPDVLALAADLPWGGGDGVLQIIGEEAALKSVPVILIDGDSNAIFPHSAMPANVVGRLVKPLDVDTLFELGFAAADCRDVWTVAIGGPDNDG